MEDGVSSPVVVLAFLTGASSFLLQTGRESGNIPARAYVRAQWGSGDAAVRVVVNCVVAIKVGTILGWLLWYLLH